MNKAKLFRGLATTFCSAFAVLLSGSLLAEQYAPVINSQLSLETSKVVSKAGKKGEIYFRSEFGDIKADNLSALVEAAREQTYNEEAEGAVLLYNKANALPLSSSERGVTFFGKASTNFVNIKPGTCPKLQEPITLRDALDKYNFHVNETLWQAYENDATTPARSDLTGEIGEASIGFYTDNIKKSWMDSSDYTDVAFVVLARESSEGSDLLAEDADGVSALALHQREKDLLKMIKDSGRFSKTVVLLNTGAPMELEWLYDEQYGVDACLWIGTTGETGMQAVVDILVGEVNPSGHCVDTYASNSLGAPAMIASCSRTQQWANLDEMKRSSLITDNIDGLRSYVLESEGIYTGYKYYETRYEDSLANPSYGASSARGSLDGAAWDYAKEMTFPFGHGLSYTDFEQTLLSVTPTDHDTMEMKVKVKNIGSVPGKSVVQAYVQTPYGDYEKANYVEKSAVTFIDFGKTKVLDPDEEETITMDVDKYLMASYDWYNAKTYIMSEGTYYLAIGNDAHDALNNVLAARGVPGLVDPEGNPVGGDAAKVYSWHEDFDKDTYSKSSTGYPVTNQFDDCNILHFYPDKKVEDFYITRQHWDTTYPTGPIALEATEEMMRYLNNYFYKKADDAPSAATILKGVSKGITLVDMMGVPYEGPYTDKNGEVKQGEDTWEEFLTQFTYDELALALCDGAGTKEIAKYIKPATKHGDGMDGNGNGVFAFQYHGKRWTANQYTAKVVLTSTFNRDLYRRRGEMMGEECLWLGMQTIFGIGGDFHRNAFCGRNPEYMAEDPILCYHASIPEVDGYVSKGVLASIKHFAGNTQETDRGGVSMLFTEQSWREADLRAFEGCLRKSGNGHGLMQGLNRVGLRYGPTVEAMHTTVLRKEWGFFGTTETDGCQGLNFKTHWCDMVHAGTSVYCLDSTGTSGKSIIAQIKKTDDGTLLKDIKRAVKDYFWVSANSCTMNGLSNDVVVVSITPWWETMIYIANPVVGGLALASLAGYVVFRFVIKKKEETSNA